MLPVVCSPSFPAWPSDFSLVPPQHYLLGTENRPGIYLYVSYWKVLGRPPTQRSFVIDFIPMRPHGSYLTQEGEMCCPHFLPKSSAFTNLEVFRARSFWFYDWFYGVSLYGDFIAQACWLSHWLLTGLNSTSNFSPFHGNQGIELKVPVLPSHNCFSRQPVRIFKCVSKATLA